MGIEDSDKPKNPWADGDKYEAELGPDEVNKLRAEHRKRSILKEVAINVKADMAKARSETDPRLGKERLLDASRNFFRQVIDMNGGTATERFDVDKVTGKIRVDTTEYFSRDDPSKPKFLMCLLPTAADENPKIGAFTADEIRTAASVFMETHPDVIFSFDEDRAKGTFSYVATLKVK